ncbi:MAG TPA: bestrophin family ion channel [Bryobacteraceae bacterium]|nr:bestrophin family ion channel [Bryobacteraceae bacterium]
MIDYNPHHWWDHFFDIRGSMVREITVRVLTCVAWSGLVVWFHTHVRAVAMPVTVHSLVGLALGLLLVFRTNASYDRFWEGRRQWGNIVNATRNLARAARPHLSATPDLYRELVHWTIAFPFATMNRLRGTRGFGESTLALPADKVTRVQGAQHPAVACAAEISAVLMNAREAGLIGEFTQMMLDGYVQQLIDALGACERIHSTPLPFAYMVHLRRALVLYCFSLPFAIVEQFRWETVPVILFIAYTFFGIEEIGVEIEDPFGEDANDLPLDRFCKGIEATLLSLIPQEQVAEA